MINIAPKSLQLREYILGIISKYLKLKGCATILCYHSISDDGHLFSVTKKDFELQIKEILKSKHIVSLENLFNIENDHINNKIVITFDDGYENIFTSAYPILKKYGLQACVFISTFINKKGKSNYFSGKRLMNLEQIKKLVKEGWEIGYHTNSHIDLRHLDKRTLVNEIVNNKQIFEKDLGSKIIYFAYPYGLYNKETVDTVEKAGYKLAFTADGCKVNYYNSLFRIGRVLIDKYTKTEDLDALTSCQGLYFNRLLTSLLRFKDDYFSSLKIIEG